MKFLLLISIVAFIAEPSGAARFTTQKVMMVSRSKPFIRGNRRLTTTIPSSDTRDGIMRGDRKLKGENKTMGKAVPSTKTNKKAGDGKGKMKGSLGRGKVGKSDQKAESGNIESCTKITVMASVEDLEHAREENEIGDALYVPIYDTDSTWIGYYADVATSFGEHGDCIFHGAFQFDYNEENEGFDSHLSVQGACSNSEAAVVGGSGAGACATGTQTINHVDDYDYDYDYYGEDDWITTTLHICIDPICRKPSVDDY